MRGIEGKDEVLKQEHTDKSMVATGFIILDIWEMLGGFDVFMGRDEGDGKKGRGP